MITTYQVTMDSGMVQDIECSSAGEAIHLALNRMRGHGVKSVKCGGELAKKIKEDQLFPDYASGFITFDVPKHDPLPLEIHPGRQKVCARYVRPWDTIEDGVFEYIVYDIQKLPKLLLFEVRNPKTKTFSSLEIKPDNFVTIVRGATKP